MPGACAAETSPDCGRDTENSNAMKINPRLRMQLLLQSSLTLLLLIVLTTLLAYLAKDYRKEWDVTRSTRHTLSQATLEVLGQLDGPLAVTVYATARDGRGQNLHKSLQEFMRPYQRVKPDIALAFVDPREQPKAAAAAGVRAPVEMVVEYNFQRTGIHQSVAVAGARRRAPGAVAGRTRRAQARRRGQP
jgi:hypothetical protein